MEKEHYFDWAATSPADEDILKEALEESLKFWGNPSSTHEVGKKARQLFEEARGRAAAALGVKPETMTEQTANDVVEFINKHYGGKKLWIRWFGGEPTVAADRIDQISNGLKDKGITFVSTMISNGYLFDEEMVNKAKSLWNLKRVQISVDGMEEHYNEVKNYVNALDNPFIRVMRNIRLLLEKEIHVDLRMNFDIGNYKDFERLLKYATTYYKEYKGLKVYAYPVIGDYPDKTGKILHGSDEWRRKTSIELNDRARSAGMYQQKDELPHLKYIGCSADQDNSVTINPQGMLVECPEQFDECQSIGNLEEGIVNKELVNQWKMIADHERCRECVFFPRCVRLMNCSAKARWAALRNATFSSR